jgi:16S rRNA (guanine527-N7)-methyltransferase
LSFLRKVLTSVTVSRETLLPAYFPERGKEVTRYAEILATKGIEWGLIGPREGDRIWERHIANCIPITTLMKEGATVLDVGSGAGLPGIVIALARPDLKVTLLEPLARRVDFLNETITELGVPITVVRSKAGAYKGSFDYVVARAVAPLPKLYSMARHLIAPGGSLLAMKGERAEEEMAGLSATLHQLDIGELPPSRIVEIAKAG